MDEALNLREARRYLDRVDSRWQLSGALLGGAQVDDAKGALPQRERGSEYVVILVSEGFDGIPWLERVYHAAALWDSSEMGHAAEVHCYTAVEYERQLERGGIVARTAERGLDMLADPALP